MVPLYTNPSSPFLTRYLIAHRVFFQQAHPLGWPSQRMLGDWGCGGGLRVGRVFQGSHHQMHTELA